MTNSYEFYSGWAHFEVKICLSRIVKQVRNLDMVRNWHWVSSRLEKNGRNIYLKRSSLQFDTASLKVSLFWSKYTCSVLEHFTVSRQNQTWANLFWKMFRFCNISQIWNMLRFCNISQIWINDFVGFIIRFFANKQDISRNSKKYKYFQICFSCITQTFRF